MIAPKNNAGLLNSSTKLIIEKLLIILSCVYCMSFLIDIPMYLNYAYIFALIGLYITYLCISKIELEVSYITILSTVLLGYIYVTTIYARQLEYKEIRCCIIAAMFILLQLNNLIFKKHYKFTIKCIILTLLAFYLFLGIRIITTKTDAFSLIEHYFDNIGIFAIFISLSTIVILHYVKKLAITHIYI